MRSKTRKCRWCRKRLDRDHPYTESFCFVKNEKKIRSRLRPRVKRISDVYEAGHLKPEFLGTDMEDKLMDRQREKALNAILGLGENGYVVPKNVSRFLNQGFVWNQIAHEKPWAVYVLIPAEDGVKRKRKRLNNLWDAVLYHEKIHARYPSSGIVSLGRAYDLPPEWRFKKEKLPKRFKWCPHCGEFRVFKIVEPREEFSVLKKVWSDEKGRYEWKERTVYLIECQLCGHTNRNTAWRRANQPWEIRKIKQGVRRVKPRVRTTRGKQNVQRKKRTRR